MRHVAGEIPVPVRDPQRDIPGCIRHGDDVEVVLRLQSVLEDQLERSRLFHHTVAHPRSSLVYRIGHVMLKSR